jgi:hypothetical protein
MQALLCQPPDVDIEIDDSGGRITASVGFERSGLPDDRVVAEREPVVEMVRAVRAHGS